MTEPRPVAPLSCAEASDLAAGFVLGSLDAEETARLRDHLSTCPEPHSEIDELGGVAPYLTDTLEPVEPPADLGRRILAAVAAEAAAKVERGAATAPPSRGPVSPPLAWGAAIAAVLVIATLGAWNLSLRTELEAATAYDTTVQRVIGLATAPGGQAAILKPQVPGGPAGIAAVGPDGRVEIALRDLAPTSGTEVYEAWLIGPDKTPVALGSLTPGSGGLGVLHAAGAPAGQNVTIALTREPTAGRTSPTPPVLSAGVASGST
jgi:anti-sigma factor RsiW